MELMIVIIVIVIALSVISAAVKEIEQRKQEVAAKLPAEKGPSPPAIPKVTAAVVELQDGHDYIRNSIRGEYWEDCVYTHLAGCRKCQEIKKYGIQGAPE